MRICERLPEMANFNIFVLAHENANEPATIKSATVTELRQQFVASESCNRNLW
jgi:hypothetical protein